MRVSNRTTADLAIFKRVFLEWPKMGTDVNEIAKALRLFNEKSDKLARLSFMEKMSDPNVGITLSWERTADGETRTSDERRGPQEESIDAFVLTFRFFIQDNEQSSFRMMDQHYRAAPIPNELKQEFFDLRKRVNDYLDAPPPIPINVNNELLTRRRIMNVCLYGGLAHANAANCVLYKTWMSIPHFGVMLEHVFVSILADIHDAIALVRRLNEKALHYLPGPS